VHPVAKRLAVHPADLRRLGPAHPVTDRRQRQKTATPANIQEVALAGALVQGDEPAVFADRGYDAGWLHRALAERGIADGIMRRNRTNQVLSPDEIARNHALSLRRRSVEKLFGTLKRSYRLNRECPELC
jgi:IS5 family transposase